jgi:hypothetical protein
MFLFAIIALSVITLAGIATAIYGWVWYTGGDALGVISVAVAITSLAFLIGVLISHYDDTHISKTEACQVTATENITTSITQMSKVDGEYFRTLLDSASNDGGMFGVGDDTYCKNLATLAVRAETVAFGDRSSMPGVEGSNK